MTTIEQIKELVKKLSADERSELLQDLSWNITEDTLAPLEVKYCPHCKSLDFIKHGYSKHGKRFKCKSCHRTFCPTTGTAIHNIKEKDKFIEYSRITKEEGLQTIAHMKKRISICNQASFDWRHRLLLSTPKKKEKFEQEVQMDDLWFLYSQKGRKGLDYARERGGSKRKGDNDFQVKVLAASDKKQLELKVAKIGRISEKDIIQAVGEKFNSSSKLVTDKHKSFGAFAKGVELDHVSFLSKNHKAGTGENVQYVNNVAERLKTWINRQLRGVSTKYLQLYVSYFSYTENENFDINKNLDDHFVWDKFTNIEGFYKRFIQNKSVRTYRCPTKREWKAQNWNGTIMQEFSFI